MSNPTIDFAANVEQFKQSNRNGFDYVNQAWVVNGRYQRCGHPVMMPCACFGRIHEGELPAANASIR